MFDWLLVLLTPVLPDVTPPKKDYVGVVAAEVAYSAAKTSVVVKKKVPTKDCKTCNGTGKVQSGDGLNWSKCPDCEPTPGDTLPDVKIPKSEPGRYKTSDCPNGKCPLYQS